MKARRIKVLAVASSGGHWVELLRIIPSCDGADVTFVTVEADYHHEVPGNRIFLVNDSTRWSKRAALILAVRLLFILLLVRPDVVISTGAAPGYFALRLGKMLRCRTVWIDSLANVAELSLSGQMSRKYADLWLTQWPHHGTKGADETSGRPVYAGAVL